MGVWKQSSTAAAAAAAAVVFAITLPQPLATTMTSVADEADVVDNDDYRRLVMSPAVAAAVHATVIKGERVNSVFRDTDIEPVDLLTLYSTRL